MYNKFSMDITKVDKNFEVKQLNDELVDYYNYDYEKFSLYGLEVENGLLCRIKNDIAKKISEGVFSLRRNTAGGRLKFTTNSSFLSINCEMPHFSIPQMTEIASSGFDVTVKEIVNDKQLRYSRILQQPYGESNGSYTSMVKFGNNNLKEITICFPLYNNVDKLTIGLEHNCILQKSREYKYSLPIVYYGSSITQGASASRPSMAYEELLSQKIDCDYINYGFSGSACGEQLMAEYLSNLDMSVLVMDYDHNAKTVEDLKNTHLEFYQTFRKNKKDIPIIFISRPDFKNTESDIKRRDIIFETYKYAKQHKDKNVFFIDGEKIYPNKLRNICSVDSTHPNDIGMYCYYLAFLPYLKKLVK